MLLFVGIAISVALYNTQRQAYLWGLVPAAVGVAQLLFYYFEGRKTPPQA